MSRLATAMHAQPAGTWVDKKGAALQRLQILLDQHEQCGKAFMQAPSPRLGKALAQIEREIAYARKDRNLR